MRAAALFAAVMGVIVAAAAWVFTRVYPTDAGQHAVLVSAVIAIVVQLFGFAMLRLANKSNPIGAWGLGVLLRMGVLAVYALVAVKAFALPSTPALLSLATFFFLSTLVEPLLLTV